MSANADPFRSENALLEEQLRRTEEELAQLAEAHAALAPRREAWRRETRKRSFALALTAVLSVAVGAGTSFGMARSHAARMRGLEAENLEAKVHKEDRATEACHTITGRARGNLFGCLRVTERGLASRVDIHVFGEHLGSPVRRQMFLLGVSECAAPPFRTEVTFEPTGTVSLVKLAPLGKSSLTTGETLCLDHVFRAAALPPWSGAPMLVVAEYKAAR